MRVSSRKVNVVVEVSVLWMAFSGDPFFTTANLFLFVAERKALRSEESIVGMVT